VGTDGVLPWSWSWSCPSLRGRFVARGNPETDIVFCVVVRLSLCVSEATRAQSLNAVYLFVVVFPSPLAGEDGLRSKHGEGSQFLFTAFYLLPLPWFWVVIARGSL
jgi:hypothetical protein